MTQRDQQRLGEIEYKLNDLSWAVAYRMRWINEALDTYGFITRQQIINKFGCGGTQATADLAKFREIYGEHSIVYIPSILAYVRPGADCIVDEALVQKSLDRAKKLAREAEEYGNG